MVLPSMVGFFQRAHLSRMKIGGFFLHSLYAQGISFTLTTPSQIEKKENMLLFNPTVVSGKN
jgi:hypothetical protein